MTSHDERQYFLDYFYNTATQQDKKMEESKRQKQVAQLVMEEMGSILLKEGLNMFKGGMVSISKVSMTPDLLEARIYLSLFQMENDEEVLEEFESRNKEIRKSLGDRLRNQLRRIPLLRFYKDDTLDHVFKMEALFDKINQERKDSTDKDNS